ncbi:MAG: flagellar protein [Lachnospiraceae bacterium]|nr:flagellar protein [Lachnospiraceae bacterium]MBQ2576492.1 flagellar protein [Lachnospiraceae bacterium]MBQ5484125.1 flagellar protein [Lachnospiraceae bacterium]MCR4732911.1 flagellar protein [Lachnospiraceae bacterium]
MEVRNCRKCGRMFNYLGGPPICAACRKDAEMLFQKVRDYIRDNPKASISQICEDCGCTNTQLRQWIREERLEFSRDSDITMKCENCGASIRTGRFCDKCKNSMADSLGDVYRQPEVPLDEPKKPDKDGNRMRFRR